MSRPRTSAAPRRRAARARIPVPVPASSRRQPAGNFLVVSSSRRSDIAVVACSPVPNAPAAGMMSWSLLSEPAEGVGSLTISRRRPIRIGGCGGETGDQLRGKDFDRPSKIALQSFSFRAARANDLHEAPGSPGSRDNGEVEAGDFLELRLVEPPATPRSPVFAKGSSSSASEQCYRNPRLAASFPGAGERRRLAATRGRAMRRAPASLTETSCKSSRGQWPRQPASRRRSPEPESR